MFWDKLRSLSILRRSHPTVAGEPYPSVAAAAAEDPFTLIPDLTWHGLVEWINEQEPAEATIIQVAETPVEPPTPGFRISEIRDRVVRSLLDAGQLAPSVVERVWNSWSQGGRMPLWRALLTDPAVDREQVYAQAARCYAYRSIALDLLASCCQIEGMMDRLRGPQWEQMVRLGLLPVVELGSAPGETWRPVLACPDPTHRQVESLLCKLDFGPVELCHTPRINVYAVAAECFPAFLPVFGVDVEPGAQTGDMPVLQLVDRSTSAPSWHTRHAA